MPAPIPQIVEETATHIVDAAYRVHKELGPGLLESVYETCLAYEIRDKGCTVATQVAMPVTYRELTIDAGLRLDLIVNDVVIVELKAVDKLLPIHRAQTLTYLKLAPRRLALLINFNTPLIKDGIERVVL